MFPTPKGYISIPDAVDRVSRALHGEPKTIPWRGKDLDEFAELDEAVLRSGREQTTEAQDWLIAELSAGRLVAQVGNFDGVYPRPLAPIGLAREGSLNASWLDGGAIFAPPMR